MAFANNMALQVDAASGLVRMVFVEARGPIVMPEAGIEETGPVSRTVADVIMPAGMALEISKMLVKALSGMPTVEQVQEALADVKAG